MNRIYRYDFFTFKMRCCVVLVKTIDQDANDYFSLVQKNNECCDIANDIKCQKYRGTMNVAGGHPCKPWSESDNYKATK